MDGPGIEVSIEGFSSDAFYRDGERIDDTGKPDGYKMLYEEERQDHYVRLSQLITDPPMNYCGPHNHVFPLVSQFSFSNYIKVIYTDTTHHSFSTADGSSDQLGLKNGDDTPSEFVMPEPDNVGKVTIHYLSRTN
jgi:hypothetical protein